jgi:hypothetical protein
MSLPQRRAKARPTIKLFYFLDLFNPSAKRAAGI